MRFNCRQLSHAVLALALAFCLSAPAWAALPCELLLRDRVPVEVGKVSLSKIVEKTKPWDRMESNSDQRQPLYLGASPRDLALGKPPTSRPRLYAALRELGTAQAQFIRKALGAAAGTPLEFEAWPVQNDEGQLTWAFARYRKKPASTWEWLDADALELPDAKEGIPAPILPRTKKTWVKKDFKALFTDVLKMKDLYGKPLFGDAVWMTADTNQVIAAWLPVELLEAFKSELEANPNGHLVSRILPQPARFNEKPITFVLKTDGRGVRFPRKIQWAEPHVLKDVTLSPAATTQVVTRWPRNFDAAYEHDIRVLSGRETADFPRSGRKVKFKRKNSVDVRNQLEDLVDYLEERYRQLGVRTVRQRFLWRNVPQSNLVAIIPGSLKGAANKPILMADHIDTAFSEDAYNKTGKRISAPGADDNDTATAALLRAAEVLKDSQPLHDIWLTHLTGEEFPADDLGALAIASKAIACSKSMPAIARTRCAWPPWLWTVPTGLAQAGSP
ncbi:MAG: M28 family peptidase [Deltaproteobacteria bacterium]|nr:M28 family peptidase [Deltaproteobacteria bacterium]